MGKPWHTQYVPDHVQSFKDVAKMIWRAHSFHPVHILIYA
jgi:hypothetical protein